jgi:benzoyl-CoA reductase/2-hydroxyglutaryl-CoA dehydratase subunit BcrC/BadD/HgdB
MAGLSTTWTHFSTRCYEAFAEHATMHIMEVPQCKAPCDRSLFRSELVRYKDALEKLTGKTITVAALAEATTIVNAKRRALQRLSSLRAADPAPISGRDALLINQISFYDDPLRFTAKINELCDEIEARVAAGQGVAPAKTPRLLLAGCPMAVPNWKLPYLIESSGAVIVGEESCIGERNTRDLTDETPTDLDGMLDALTDRYMKIDCACFTPNDERLANIAALAGRLKADGVIHYGLLFCQPYAHEAMKVGKAMAAAGIPYLAIETDYGMEDAGQLKTRVEAFVETLA